MTAVLLILAAVGAYLTVYVGYQALLFAANTFVPDPAEFEPSRFRRFDVLIPAHNEELYLPRLLASLRTQHYPPEQVPSRRHRRQLF